ncbi:Target of rapamycin complex 2 subunit ste20 [Schizosaccharomyces pombe]|uniref:Target of rapamycin complex 2 subunit ste20 n=1 Tax=Schizosaccharomyces pombe (strain 972 / ATCC 24843) TaxID=284812 RepID=RICTR_SCHPO|nr:target of rapamycin complex 2 subunit ste20 [Schizosaccharomyces pombe]Q09743.1 RecName: Full=Target of rapamycin complex 2 subunit ste20; Short=TORC2 subunit ste20 [Schizosaccharomyces pombe 972h-]CAA11758.1 Ste20 protein [Schizosaccharomyces pombe]CAA90815.1 Rictor homolog, Ste20 [Schizosaccharomyces pombe]|eukprot:NP_596021.1 target of rapamycin complex 2 subunit ste20 [Schizosaccharomyces pombe]
MKPVRRGQTDTALDISSHAKTNGDFIKKMNTTDSKRLKLLEDLKGKLEVECKIRDGAETLLQVFDTNFKKETKERKEMLKKKCTDELESSKKKIEELVSSIESFQGENGEAKTGSTSLTRSASATVSRKSSLQEKYSTRFSYKAGCSDSCSVTVSGTGELIGPTRNAHSNLTPTVIQRIDFENVNEKNNSSSEDTQPNGKRPSSLQSNFSQFPLNPWLDNIYKACLEGSMKDVIDSSNNLCEYLHEHSDPAYAKNFSLITPTILSMLELNVSEVTASVYRLLRHLFLDATAFSCCQMLNLPWILSKSLLSGTDAYQIEREQAFRLIRTLYFLSSTEGHEDYLSGITRTIISICEHVSDVSRGIAVETLIELMIIRPKILFKANGLRVLMISLIDGSISENLAASAALALVYLLDDPESACYVNLPYDIGILLSPFTSSSSRDTFNSSEEQSEQAAKAMKSSAKVASVLLNSWSGLLALSTNDFQALRSIVDTLRVPSFAPRSDVIDLFFLIFQVEYSSWSESFLAGKRLTVVKNQAVSNDDNINMVNIPDGSNKKYMSLRQHFTAVLLFIFLELGLVESIVCMIRASDDPSASRKATYLLGEVLRLSDELLPIHLGAKIQSLPSLFNMASQFTAEDRFVATSVLQSIESLNRVKFHSATQPFSQTTSLLFKEQKTDGSFRGQRQVEHVKLKMGMQIDDSHFRSMLAETNVLATKNYQKWRWDTLVQIMEGPLLSPKRIDETLRTTKFMRRLLAFYKPFSNRFSSIQNTKPNQKFIKVGCLVFRTLLANPEGVKYLSESKVIKQIAESLSQIDGYSEQVSEPIFSNSRLQKTLTHGYFPMLKVLSSQKEGHAIMERWRIFTTLYHLTELRNRDDLIIIFLTNLDYRLEGHTRIIFSKALNTGQQAVRLTATKHLAALINSESANDNLNHWAISLLIFQLYDPCLEVCKTAVKVLNEVCARNENLLAQVVQLQPSLAHLGEIGSPLLLRFLATTVGFHYLSEINFIEHELDNWYHHRNIDYVDLLEQNFFLSFVSNLKIIDKKNNEPDENILPLHFYGELVKSPQGCEVLESSGHFESFMGTLVEFYDKPLGNEAIRQLKSALWAIGNIGKTDQGITFLINHDTIPLIVKYAENSLIPTVRGTAYFVLGLISRTSKGVEILESLHWYSLMSLMGTSQGICIPRHAGQVLSTPRRNVEFVNERVPTPEFSSLLSSLTNSEREVIRLVSNLSNHVLTNESARQLTKIRSKNAKVFSSKRLVKACMTILGKFHYRVQIQQFVFELFPYSVLLSSSTSQDLNESPSRPNNLSISA